MARDGGQVSYERVCSGMGLVNVARVIINELTALLGAARHAETMRAG